MDGWIYQYLWAHGLLMRWNGPSLRVGFHQRTGTFECEASGFRQVRTESFAHRGNKVSVDLVKANKIHENCWKENTTSWYEASRSCHRPSEPNPYPFSFFFFCRLILCACTATRSTPPRSTGHLTTPHHSATCIPVPYNIQHADLFDNKATCRSSSRL